MQSGHFMQSGEGGGAPQPNMDMVLTTAEEIASGMAFLHAQGIVHGDLTGGARSRRAGRPRARAGWRPGLQALAHLRSRLTRDPLTQATSF